MYNLSFDYDGGTLDAVYLVVLMPINRNKPYYLLSQPTLRREGDAGLAGASSKKGIRGESPPTFI